ncbi:MAG: hypothetical protein QNJ41_29000 [Xenococcaceae cyanobacterium MO_188.B32]|nr:hypothetical protein [Xenococcaceae cyanobacterium MO_188.B32]
MTERTPGSNLDVVDFLALPIAFGVRKAGTELRGYSSFQLNGLRL